MPEQNAVNLHDLVDLCTPWCLHVVGTLRIAEHLESGLSSADELAAATGCDAGALDRVLRHLVARGVFEQPAPGRFALNEPARGLLEPGLRLFLDLDGVGGRVALAWSSLLTAVRTGKCAYHEVFGRPFWQDLAAHRAIGDSFDQLLGPHGHGTPSPEILVHGDWDAVRTVVDVGGGTGALLAEILKAQPHLQGTLVDVPRACAASAPVFAAADVTDRARTAPQSFFETLPAGADLYTLKSVLSDWPDAEATAILRRCADAARPNGRVVVVSGVTPEPVAPPELMMLVLVGGKGRTLPEFAALARDAGLTIVAAGRTPGGGFSVECRPV